MYKRQWMRMLPAAALILGGLTAEAQVELAPVFSDNAVLQRDMNVPIWGFADPGESVTVKFADQTQTTTAGQNGKWMVKLSPLAASKENRTLTVSGKDNTVTANNILVGEVWIASGQSNMEMPLWGNGENYRHRNANGTGKEVADKTDLPLLRFTNMPRKSSTVPVEKEAIKWSVAVPGPDLERASATAFFFGRELQKTLDIPIGILGAYWGGTRIEPWTPPEGFDSVEELASIARSVNAKIPGTKAHKEVSEKVVADYSAWLAKYNEAIAKGEQPPLPPEFPNEQKPFSGHQQPTVLYNHMLYGFVPYAVRGGIWYQGESNRGDGMLYKSKMQALLNGWKSVFQNPNMKFYFVQIAPFTYGGDSTVLARLQEAQQSFADNEKDAGMAVVSDAVHNIRDIHPADKEIVGKRLAYLALNRDYGRKDIKADSPKLKASRTEGNKFILEFDFVESWKSPVTPIPFFEVAGIDGGFVPANATIDGTRLIVSADNVAEPQHLRYMWHETNEGKLANEAGLVLGPFRVIGKEADFDTLLSFQKQNSKLLYEYDLKSGSGFGDKTQVKYAVDNSNDIKGRITRVTYLIELIGKDGAAKFVSVSLDPFTTNAKQLGVPTKASGARFQSRVFNLNVISNVAGLQTGSIREGNIEFWPNNYGPQNKGGVPGADGNAYDFGDEISSPEVGYGSMQIHNFAAKQTIFAYNNFSTGAGADLGIGNQSGKNPDWTFSGAAKLYDKATLYVFVKEEARDDSSYLAKVKACVPEAESMRLAYAYDLRTGTAQAGRTRVNYAADNSDVLTGKAKKVAYLMVLTGNDNKEEWVYASMDAFDPSVAKLGVPTKASGAVFQKRIANLDVKSNTAKVKTGTFAEGNIEFWSSNYAAPNATQIPGASDAAFDFGDRRDGGTDPGYGSMQVHNFLEKQTVFAYNKFDAGPNADAGIGNAPGANSDWTFSSSLKNYKAGWLYVLVDME